MKTIAVLLTVHNRRDKTLQCLQHLFLQESIADFEIEVFMVDDGCTDGTPEIVLEQYPSVHIIKGNGDLFWNRGMHMAWQTAAKHKDFDYYLWLNDDTLLVPNAIQELLVCENGQASVVCGAICSEKDYCFTYGGHELSGKNIEPNGEVQPCMIINGNCVLVSKRVYQVIGTLDEIFPHAIGDYDYGLRALKMRFRVVTTRKYIGFCEQNFYLPKWCYADTPLAQRFKVLYSPLGNAHPIYFFIYENRHFGILRAVKHFCSIHLRALIPSIWK